jgi:hypothetical protein
MNAFLSSLESKTIADQMLAHFILPNGLPKLMKTASSRQK